jgi:PAS domain S-box-containing protein
LWFDRHSRLNEQQNINNHASIISYSVWSFDPDLAKDYLQLACKANKYSKLKVLHSSNENFISIDNDLESAVDLVLESFSILKTTSLTSKIFYKAQGIGQISVEWYNTAIYTYFYVLVITVLLLTIFWFLLTEIKHKNELEQRVQERTIHLSKEIKERKQAEETRSKILEASIGGIYIYDLDLGRNIYVNPQYTALTGYTLEKISSMDRDEFSRLFHPDNQPEVSEHIRSVVEDLSDGENLNIDYRFKYANGGWKWFKSCDAVYERDAKGRVRQFIGTFIDITDHKNSELYLKESEERFRSLVVASPQLIYLIQEGKFIYGNPSGIKALGYKNDKDIIKGC